MSKIVEVKYVDAGDLKPNPHQPRQGFDQKKLEALAESLRQVNVLQPIIVRKDGQKYQIIAGERRWRASRLAGLDRIPVLVKDTTEQRVLVESLIENLHREDLTSLERENAIYELWKSRLFPSHRELAKTLGYADHKSVDDIIESREFRERVGGVPPTASTTLISVTQGLDDKTRVRILKRAEQGELAQRPIDGGVGELVTVLKKAPEPLKQAVLAEEIPIEEAKQAISLYEEAEKGGQPVSEAKVKRHVRRLKKEVAEQKSREKARLELHRILLTGKKSLQREMSVNEGVVYDIGKFTCPVHKKEYTLKCDGEKPHGKHWAE